VCVRIPLVVINYKCSDETIECIKTSLANLDILSKIILVDNSKEISDNSFAKFERSRGRQLSDLDEDLITTLDKRVSVPETWISDKLIYLPTDYNIGFTGGSNIGAKMAKAIDSEYVFFLIRMQG
jgi:GT2 family glycosyltransferase